MKFTLARVLSLTIGLAYVAAILIAAVAHAQVRGMIFEVCGEIAVVLFPMALIWFPDAFTTAPGFLRERQIVLAPPPIVASIMGWLILLGLPIFAYFVTR